MLLLIVKVLEWLVCSGVLFSGLLSTGCSDSLPVSGLTVVDGEIHEHDHRTKYNYGESDYASFKPVPRKHNEALALASLGERLFHDPQLSADKTIACASCHSVQHGGDDGLSKAIGVKQAVGEKIRQRY